MPQGYLPAQDRNDAITAVLNITAATAVKTAPARVIQICVLSCSTVAGAVYDATAQAGTVAANSVFTIPATVGLYRLEWPCKNGVYVVPGTGSSLSISLA